MTNIDRSYRVAVSIEAPDGSLELVAGTLTQTERSTDYENGDTYVIHLTDYTVHRKEQTTMTTKQYTAEDFANAEAARHPETERVAVRVDCGQWTLPWAASARPNGGESYVWLSDQNLAEQGWEPAYVSRNPQKMRRHVSDLEAIIKRRGEDIARLEEQKARLARELAVEREQTIDLDALQAAWEGAEEGIVNKGDVIIRRACDGEDFAVWVSVCAGNTEEDDDLRILHRAPEREPWQDLADVLRAWDEEPMDADLMGRARWMHERGVRVTEGEK